MYIWLLSPKSTWIGIADDVGKFISRTNFSLIDEILLPESKSTSYGLFPIDVLTEHIILLEEVVA